MASETVDGMNVLAMYEATSRAVALARAEKLPTLIEARTYRYMGHSMADPIHGHYRTKEELEEQKARDPIEQLRTRLIGAELMTANDVSAEEASVMDEVEEALRFAEESPEPDPADLGEYVYHT
jgi:pyruvate dehydrogenase E1 component alpha subunit